MTKILHQTAIAAAITLALVLPAHADPARSWTGCYAGLNAAYAWANASATTDWNGSSSDIGSARLTGGAGGGQLGCDYQTGDLVVGGKVAFNGADINGAHAFAGGSSASNQMAYKVNNYGSLTARLGYVLRPDTLGYLGGGYAWASTRYDDSDPAPFGGWAPYSGSTSLTRNGWTLGLGLEQRFRPDVSMFVGWDYMDFGSRNATITSSDGFVESYRFKQSMNVLTIGLNYRF